MDFEPWYNNVTFLAPLPRRFFMGSRASKRDPNFWMRVFAKGDMREVLQIEQATFEQPWTEEDFRRCLRLGNCIFMVAELRRVVAGFMVYQLLARQFYMLNFAVHPAYRRKGIGTKMVEKIASVLRPEARNEIIFDVRETNLPIQLFLQKSGFWATRVLRSHYEDTGEDGYRMVYPPS
jgi:ribosomal-protein-alanine N-acetyltransferase